MKMYEMKTNVLVKLDKLDEQIVYLYMSHKSSSGGVYYRQIGTMETEDLDGMSNDELLKELREAGESGVWCTMEIEINKEK